MVNPSTVKRAEAQKHPEDQNLLLPKSAGLNFGVSLGALFASSGFSAVLAIQLPLQCSEGRTILWIRSEAAQGPTV